MSSETTLWFNEMQNKRQKELRGHHKTLFFYVNINLYWKDLVSILVHGKKVVGSSVDPHWLVFSHFGRKWRRVVGMLIAEKQCGAIIDQSSLKHCSARSLNRSTHSGMIHKGNDFKIRVKDRRR